MQGRLIVLEGLDGSGKSTQLELLRASLEKSGRAVRCIKLPDYDDPSSALVRMYLGGEFGADPQDVNAYTASAFYAVDRAANYLRKWKADYLGGTLILADRYTTSNAYHQLQKLPRDAWDAYLDWLEDFEYGKLGLPRPDAVIYLDMPIDVSQRLLRARYAGDESRKDIHEANVAYLRDCRTAALYAAQKLGWHVVDCAADGCAKPVEAIASRVSALVLQDI